MHAVILAGDRRCLERVAGVPIVPRLVRTLAGVGVGPVHVLSVLDVRDTERLRDLLADRDDARVVQLTPGSPVGPQQIDGEWPADEPRALVLAAELTVHRRLPETAVAAAGTTALFDRRPPEDLRSLLPPAPDPDLGHQVPLAVVERAWLAGRGGGLWTALREDARTGAVDVVQVEAATGYSERLRRVVRPYWFPPPDDAHRRVAERTMVRATQKGTQDLIAYFHAPLENLLSLWCARRGISPDQVTVLGNLLAWAVVPLFLLGWLGPGLALAAVVGVLDGVDGKIARVIVRTTPIGRMEETLDGLSQVAWVTALVVYLWASGIQPWAWHIGVAIAVFGVADSQLQKLVRARTGRFIDQYGPFDHFVRLFSGRRNSFVWICIAGYLLGALDIAFAILPVLGAVTTAIHVPRAWWILRRAQRRPAPLGGGGALESTDPTF